MNVYTAIGCLVAVTVVTSFCADYLVGAIDEFAQDFKIPKAFIGLILLPIVGNAAGASTLLGPFAAKHRQLTCASPSSCTEHVTRYATPARCPPHGSVT